MLRAASGLSSAAAAYLLFDGKSRLMNCGPNAAKISKPENIKARKYQSPREETMSNDPHRPLRSAPNHTQGRSRHRRHAGGEPVRGQGPRRRADQDRARQSADRHLRRARQERTDRLPARGRPDQCQGRDSRTQDRAAVRGFHQRRRRHGGAEGAQADRARQRRFSGRQRQFGAGAGDGAGVERERRAAYRPRRPHRRHHRHRLQMERVPRLQHDAHGSQRGQRSAVQGPTARSGTSSRRITRSATRCFRAAKPI